MIVLIFVALVSGILLLKGSIFSFLILILSFIILIIKKQYQLIPWYFIATLTGGLIAIININLSINNQIIGIITRSQDNYLIIRSLTKSYYIELDHHQYEVLDLVRISGSFKELNFLSYESRFNFKDYLLHLGVEKEITGHDITVIIPSFFKSNVFRKFLLELALFKNNEVLQTFFLNTNTNLSNQLASVSLYRLLSETSFIVIVIFKVIDQYLKQKAILKKALKILLLLLLILINPNSFSLYRLLFINILYRSKVCNKVDRFSLSITFGIIALLISPNLVYNIAFQYIYLISILGHLYTPSGLLKRTKKAVFIIILSVPLTLYHNFELNYLSLILLLPLQILFGGLIISTILTTFLSFLSPIAIIFNDLINQLLSFLKQPIFYVYFPKMNEINLSIIYILIIVCRYAMEYRHRKTIKLSYAITTLFIIQSYLPYSRLFESKVVFINVGQGDATLIKHHRLSILIDTGGVTNFDIAKEVLIPFLKKEKIYSLDYLITTHDDFDHTGGVRSLIDNFKVKQYYSQNNFNDIIIKNNIFLKNYNTFRSLDNNDCSLVLSFKIKNKIFLLMGDASTQIENLLIQNYPNLDCDILKVGHHGSSTSSSLAFLKHVSPSEAIISCGFNNIYRHPSQNVINNLNTLNIRIHNTALVGSIYYPFYF